MKKSLLVALATAAILSMTALTALACGGPGYGRGPGMAGYANASYSGSGACPAYGPGQGRGYGPGQGWMHDGYGRNQAGPRMQGWMSGQPGQGRL